MQRLNPYSSNSPICSLAGGLALRFCSGLPTTPSTSTATSERLGTNTRWLIAERIGRDHGEAVRLQLHEIVGDNALQYVAVAELAG